MNSQSDQPDSSAAPELAEGADSEFLPNRLWTVPNLISMLRLALVPVFAYCIFAEYDIIALTVLIVAGLTDWLDGFIARRFNQLSRYGQMLDPAADRLYIFVTLIGLAYRDLIPWWLVAIIAARELVLLATLPVLVSRGYGTLNVHLAGKAGTFALMYAFPLLLISLFENWVGTVAWVLGWAFALWGVGLYWLSAGLYLHQVAKISREPKRPRKQRQPQ